MDLQDSQSFLITRALLCNEEAGKKDILGSSGKDRTLIARYRTGELCLPKSAPFHHSILTHSCTVVEAQVPHLNLFFNG